MFAKLTEYLMANVSSVMGRQFGGFLFHTLLLLFNMYERFGFFGLSIVLSGVILIFFLNRPK